MPLHCSPPPLPWSTAAEANLRYLSNTTKIESEHRELVSKHVPVIATDEDEDDKDDDFDFLL